MARNLPRLGICHGRWPARDGPLGTSGLPASSVRDEALQEVVAGYPSQQFVIDRDEAKDRLSKDVASLEPAEQLLVDALGELAHHPLDEGRLLRYTPRGEANEGGDRDIKIRKRTRTVREIEIENMQKTSEYTRRRGESMRGIRQTRPKRCLGPVERESIKLALKGAFE